MIRGSTPGPATNAQLEQRNPGISSSVTHAPPTTSRRSSTVTSTPASAR